MRNNTEEVSGGCVLEVCEGQAAIFGLDILGLVIKWTVVQTSAFDDSTSFSAELRILQIALQVAIMN